MLNPSRRLTVVCAHRPVLIIRSRPLHEIERRQQSVDDGIATNRVSHGLSVTSPSNAAPSDSCKSFSDTLFQALVASVRLARRQQEERISQKQEEEKYYESKSTSLRTTS